MKIIPICAECGAPPTHIRTKNTSTERVELGGRSYPSSNYGAFLCDKHKDEGCERVIDGDPFKHSLEAFGY